VAFTRTDAPLGAWAKGSLTWSDGTHHVRSPIALQPVAVSAAPEVHGDASATGSTTFSVTAGYTGALNTAVSGLVGVDPIADSVPAGPFDIDAPAAGPGTKLYHVTVDPGAKAARFSLDSSDNTADLDMFVYKDGEFVDLSASGSADEQVTLVDPEPGVYDVYINGFTTPGGSTAYHLSNFVVPNVDSGNLSISPASPISTTVGVSLELTATWTGLDPAKRWLGVISYVGAADVTLVSVG